MRSAVSVRPFVSTLSFEPTELWPWISVCLGQDFCSPGIESQGHRSRSMQTVCVLYEYLLRYPRSIDWCSRFPTSAGLGRRQQRSPERAGVVTWPALPRTSIEGSFFSRIRSISSDDLFVNANGANGRNRESKVSTVYRYFWAYPFFTC